MTKVLIIFHALLFLVVLVPRGVSAEKGGAGGPPAGAVAHEREMREEVEVKSRINKALREAAERVVSKGTDAEALKYLKMSTAAAAESERHYATADYAFALEDIVESTRLATYAIVLATERGAQVREAVFKEALKLGAESDHARKEARIRKGIAEAETFIQTAGRLLEEKEDPEARKDLSEAGRLLKSSRAALAAERYDSALKDLDTAYTLATASVRKIQGSRAELITFPRPRTGDVDEVLAYELKRNGTYLFFAAQPAGGFEGEAAGDVSRARRLSAEADGAIREGKKRAAIEKLRASTKLLIKALKVTVE